MILLTSNLFSDEATSRSVLLAVSVLALAYILLRPKLKRKDPLSQSPATLLAQQRNVERDMGNLLVELSNMSRQISAQLDTRAAKLELLIQEADQKIAALKAQGDHVPPAPPGVRLAPQSLETEFDDRHAQVYRLADAGQSCTQIAHQLDRPNGEIELILALRPKAPKSREGVPG